MDSITSKPELGNIAICVFKYFPYGGMQRDFLRIALLCDELGYKVRVYTLSWQGTVPAKLEVVRIATRGLTTHQRQRNFSQAVTKAWADDPPDCVVGFNKMPGLDIYFAADSCYLEKATFHRGGLYRLSPRFKHFARFEDAVFNARANTHILMLSAMQQRVFQRHYATPGERFSLLPAGISTDRRACAEASSMRKRGREALAIADEDLLVMMIGSGFVTKGLDRAITALAALPQVLAARTQFVVIGQDRSNRFRRMARRMKIKLRIIPGSDQIPQLLQAADILIHPAYIENTGTVILEAIVAGLPVLTTDVCGYAHYVTDADCGVVIQSPFQQQALSESLSQMLQSGRRDGWRENGIAFGRNHDLYSMHEHAVKIISEAVVAR